MSFEGKSNNHATSACCLELWNTRRDGYNCVTEESYSSFHSSSVNCVRVGRKCGIGKKKRDGEFAEFCNGVELASDEEPW